MNDGGGQGPCPSAARAYQSVCSPEPSESSESSESSEPSESMLRVECGSMPGRAVMGDGVNQESAALARTCVRACAVCMHAHAHAHACVVVRVRTRRARAQANTRA